MSGTLSPEQTLTSLHNDGAKVIAIASVMLTGAFSSVMLRFVAKSLNDKSFGVDDVLIGFALIFYLATESLVLTGGS